MGIIAKKSIFRNKILKSFYKCRCGVVCNDSETGLLYGDAEECCSFDLPRSWERRRLAGSAQPWLQEKRRSQMEQHEAKKLAGANMSRRDA
jgi:hypothetical protein